MKRRRRVEIRVERHELSIYASPNAEPAPAAYAQTPPNPAPRDIAVPTLDCSEPGGSRRVKPASCPICGSREMVLLTEAIALTSHCANSLKDSLETGACHLHCSRAGEWWVCGESLQPG